ncbi:MAG: DeoR/GlpR family DNA-binding transcription regulator [Limnochordia bacterium]|jgi:DeoR/GlpR family transcriptional regulator of sugar metabolism|nr:DeoR/GlpR family DNA-binding transcription regulator [Limnochordia bacterium]
MLGEQRRAGILNEVQKWGTVRVSNLSELFGVTEETIRRDLEELEKQGLVRRVHGGAIGVGSSFELPYHVREVKNPIEKTSIALQAVELINDGDTIMFDASSTALYTAQRLVQKKNITVVTNSLRIIGELAAYPNIRVIGVGGTLCNTSLGFIGPVATKTISQFHVDKAVFSCKGITDEHGLTDASEVDSEIKRLMVKAAKETIVVVDYSKFGRIAFCNIVHLDQINCVITDSKTSVEWLMKMRERGIRVVQAKTGSAPITRKKEYPPGRNMSI